MQYLNGSLTGRTRIIVDGDNKGAKEYSPGPIAIGFTKSIDIRDLDAPENRGEGSAQPTGGNFSGAPGDGG